MFYWGIDWSEDHHNLCIRNEAGALMSRIEFENSLSGFEQLEVERRKLGVAVSECLVAIETAHHLVVDYLLEQEYVVYIISPRATDGYRSRQRSSGAHDDDSDAALLASILRTDCASHRVWRPNNPLTQQMAVQLRLIESLRRSIHRQSNQLRAALYRVHPRMLDWFSRVTTQIALEFLVAYPTAEEAQSLSREAFETLCHQHGYSRKDGMALRYAQLQEPVPAAAPAMVQAYRDTVRTLAQVLLPQVRYRLQALAQLDAWFDQHPDAFIFKSLPGTGDLLAPGLLVKFGDHRDRFPTAAEVQALAGTCPVTERSGKRKLVKFRHGCDREFRHFAVQFARASKLQSGWAAAYRQEIRPYCDSDAHADRILANRWLAILWRLWQDRKPYDEAYHLHQRALRRKPTA
jgi:transposase